MKKTKVVCTMGPNTNDRELMKKLIENGMDVARFNFSHGDHEEQKGRMDLLKELRAELHTNTAILLDTKGPEIRTGVLKDGKKITLETGAQFTLTVDEIVGDQDRVSISYEGLVQDVDAGKLILIDDGLIGLKVISKTERDIVCEVVNGGELGEKKGVNVPNVAVRLPAITEKDKDDIRFGVEQGIDFIAASFVRNAECVLEIKAYLKELGAPFIPIIAKIENAEGIKNIDEIIADVSGMLSQVNLATQNTEHPDTLAIPSDTYTELSLKRIPETATSALKYLQDNLNGIQIVSCAELNSTATDTNPYAAKTDGKGVALLYTKDQDKLSIEVPMPFYQHPAQNRNLEVVIPCESRVVGAMIYYPLSAIIAVGV